jgi:hypothetical protein
MSSGHAVLFAVSGLVDVSPSAREDACSGGTSAFTLAFDRVGSVQLKALARKRWRCGMRYIDEKNISMNKDNKISH